MNTKKKLETVQKTQAIYEAAYGVPSIALENLIHDLEKQAAQKLYWDTAAAAYLSRRTQQVGYTLGGDLADVAEAIRYALAQADAL